MADLGEMLDTLAGVGGVDAVVVSGRDGLLIDGRENNEVGSLETLAALSSSLLGSFDNLGADLDKGAVTQAIVEFNESMAILQPAGTMGVLTMVLNSSTNLGRVRLALRKHQKIVEEALAQL